MPSKREIDAVVKAISEIPASNRGMMELYPHTLRQQLSRELIDKIANVALETAERVRNA